MTQPTYGDFADDLMRALGINPTRGNRRAFGVIVIIEGRNGYWNPMNWTLPTSYPAYNTAGVRLYPDYRTGVQMTAFNLVNNTRWAPLLVALRNAKTRIGPLTAIAKIYASWGSFPDFLGISWRQAKAVLAEVMPN